MNNRLPHVKREPCAKFSPRTLAFPASYVLKMKFSGKLISAVLLGWAGVAMAQLQLVPDAQPPMVFGGGARTIELRWRNVGGEMTNAEIRARIFQASSATAVSLGEMPWKNLPVLPGQTVLESARLDFPTVNAPTKFVVQWTGGTNQVFGRTEVLVFPTNLLGELKPLLDGEPLGLLDLGNELKPALKSSGVELVDFEESALEGSHCKLAVIFPQVKPGGSSSPEARDVSPMRGAAIWVLPPPKPGEEPVPSFHFRRSAKGTVVFVSPELLAHFSESPQAQFNFISLCKQALRPDSASNPKPVQQP